MNTAVLKRFAQQARRQLRDQVASKLDLVLSTDSAELREKTKALEELKRRIAATSKAVVIDQVAYTWFNRFCALRFMDANHYTRIGVVSPSAGNTQPEILQEAKQGVIDESLTDRLDQKRVFDLLSGTLPSANPQQEAYRLLLVAACNSYHKAMPFLFQRINDYTELLMPDDLLSEGSVLSAVREALTPETCADVEVIGWLYQFYISEKKDEVFDGLKKNKKITPENIPAATQLFTPHWIVRYLVENSLGRLWLLNRPGSKLALQMVYYIKPEQPEADFLRIAKPEEIKICDPACGSGHMLTYAFDLLYAIYEEEGYEPAEIPEKILAHNLYGIEIDERAGELAAFALTMKARAKQRRFFNKGVKPNICVLENVQFDENELKDYMDFVGRDLFTAPLQTTLRQFEEADNFGSLIRPDVTDVDGMLKILASKNVSGQLFISMTHQKVLQALRQADYLSPKYHVVIANPPYMGGKGMNGRLGAWLKENYSEARADLFTAFIERCAELTQKYGLAGIMCPNVWMFISRYESIRTYLTAKKTISNLVELPLSGFKGATVQICAFNFINAPVKNMTAGFVKLTEFRGDEERFSTLTKNAINDNSCDYFYWSNVSGFSKLPGNPIAYWVPQVLAETFDNFSPMESMLEPREGLTTGNNDQYVRFHFEVSRGGVFRKAKNRDEATNSRSKWFPHNKGGELRKWFGNDLYIVNWANDGFGLQNTMHPSGDRIWAHNFNLDYIFKPSISWSDITSKGFSTRIFPEGFIFDTTGLCAFERSKSIVRFYAAGICNSKVGFYISRVINPTMHFKPGDFGKIPYIEVEKHLIEENVHKLISFARCDWDSYETSWDFSSLPLLNPDYPQPTLKATYQNLRAHWREITLQMQRLEQENNRIFIEAYGLQDELTSEVPPNEITLTCNPHYRYGNNKSEDELETLMLADTMRELVSYAVGCMFGRYALDKPGLILANQGETIEDYLKQVSEPSFPADDDNVIPMLDGDWFTDDMTERFKEFLKVAFGADHYEANLRFVEDGLGKDIRKYFLKDFYNDHVRRYKKRPIYWLFSSPKGSFNALIYMHRYRPDTVSVVLNDYLREFRTKLTSHKNHLEAVSISGSSSQAEKTKALKEIEKVTKMIAEMEEYEREVLYPLATEQVEIDLDDGVKVNYPKFGAALKKIVGLDAKED